jgi:hypothetical protein
MNTATAAKTVGLAAEIMERAEAGPILVPRDRNFLVLRGSTSIRIGNVTSWFEEDTPVALPSLEPGRDYFVTLVDGAPVASEAEDGELDGVLGGFHFAPGGNAAARQGGDEAPAINPFSCWDLGFRPTCDDPRGMTLVDGKFWCDIYLLGSNPFAGGSSRFGVTIADDGDLPLADNGMPCASLDHPTAVQIYALLGKQLLGPEEFFAAAYGVTEATSRGEDPEVTGLDAPRTSKWGVMQATGNMSTWGNDGDPDGPRRACRFGGRWGYGVWAGSRYASVDHWPGTSFEWIGARGRSDHLQLDA